MRAVLGVCGEMKTRTCIPLRSSFIFLVSAGVGALTLLGIGEPEPRPDTEHSTSHVIAVAVGTSSSKHIELRGGRGTQASYVGSPVPAAAEPPHEVLIRLRQPFPPATNPFAPFFDRVSYRTTGPPLQTI